MNAFTKTSLSAMICLALAQQSVAEDIDIYGSVTGAVTNPNILIIIDNSANWSRSDQHWPNGMKQGQSELEALRLVAGELTSEVNVGLMLFTPGTIINGVSTPNADGSNGPGGYVRYHIRPMNNTNKAALQELIGTSTCVNGANSLNGTPNCILNNFDGSEKTAAAYSNYSAAMFEAFKYFGGYTDPAHRDADVAGTPIGRTHFGPTRYAGAPDAKSDPTAYNGGTSLPNYNPPITDASNCAKNYIIFIGNGYPSQDAPSSLLSGVNGDASQLWLTDYNTTVTTTTTQLVTICAQQYTNADCVTWAGSNYTGYDTYSCTATSLSGCNGKWSAFNVFGNTSYTTQTALGTSQLPGANNTNYADEWARFLNATDVNSALHQQNVKTYTIDVYKDNPDRNQSPLLRSMASAGGGKYFVASNRDAIVSALRTIISEIQTGNSVFASSSLPVSVNTQGTYLNQVFIGMFNPDGNGQPRWAGNLKQYQFAFFGDTLKLADNSNPPKEAINPTSGFITPCAQSFWDSDSGNYWMYPLTQAKGSCPDFPQLYSDLPDGEVVLKGGVAQKLRGVGTFGGTLTTSSTNYATRVLKTCDNANCSSLTNFNTANAAITSTLLGIGSTQRDALIDWVRGKDVDNENTNFDASGNLITAEMRPSVHGDVVHAQPAAVDYGGSIGAVVFYGSNDGIFHAVNGNTDASAGNELWGFIAPETFDRLNRLKINVPLLNIPGVLATAIPTPTPKQYFFDGSIGVYQGSGRVWIYPTMRRGGRAIYAFDVSTPTSPSLKWRKGCFTDNTTDDSNCSADPLGWADIGQTWSKPKIGYLSGYVDTSTTPPTPKPVLVFGGGYDKCEDANSQTRCTGTRKGANIWFVDANTGSVIRKYPTNYSVPGEVVLLNDDNDNITTVYAADTGGYVYRVNVGGYTGTAIDSAWTSNTAASNITIASLSETNQARKFMSGLDVVEYKDYNAILLGSGDREHPMLNDYQCGNYSTTGGNFVTNAFYMIKDVPTAYGTPVTPSNLTDVTDNLAATAASIGPGGWYFNFAQCEQSVNKPTTIGGATFFGTNQANETTPNSCETNLGTARGYAVNFLTGGSVSASNITPTRFIKFAGGGLPPSPVAGVVDVGGVKVPFLLGGSKPGESGSTPSPLEGTKVTIDPKGARSRTYWYIQGN